MKLSPLLREKLKIDPFKGLLDVVVEVKPDRADSFISNAKEMGMKIDTSNVSQPVPNGDVYVPLNATPGNLLELAKMPGVVSVNKSLPRAIGGMTLEDVPTFAVIKDKLLGDVRISDVEVKLSGAFESIPNPISMAKAASALVNLGHNRALGTGINPISDIQIFTTGFTFGLLKDVKMKEGDGVTVAILDTGSPFFTYQRPANLTGYTVIPEPPPDFMAHGSWCANTVSGRRVPSLYGELVGGAERAGRTICVKVLNTFPGAGTTQGILKGIEIAVKNGAKVISMSLGGPAQGNSVTGDIECKVINELAQKGIIFSLAVGNSGYKDFTGGSPGVAMDGISVASASILDKFSPAYWSSRGPGSEWDGKHQDEYFKLLSQYGESLIKPDVTATGGGRALPSSKPDELICSGEHGWFESFYDGIKDLVGMMHGTSQATPHVAGLSASLVSEGVVDTADDIKKYLKDTFSKEYEVENPYATDLEKELFGKYGKSISYGYGLVKLSRFTRRGV